MATCAPSFAKTSEHVVSGIWSPKHLVRRLLGVLFTPPHQVFGGFWMFRGLITVGTYVEYTDPVSFISFRTWILSTGGLGLGLLPSKQGGWPRPFGVFHLRSGTGGAWKSGEKRWVFAVVWLSGGFRWSHPNAVDFPLQLPLSFTAFTGAKYRFTQNVWRDKSGLVNLYPPPRNKAL